MITDRTQGPFPPGRRSRKELRGRRGRVREPPGRPCAPRVAAHGPGDPVRPVDPRRRRGRPGGTGPAGARVARRLTQIMNLLCLAPDIQEEILFLPPTKRGRDAVTEKQLRPIAAIPSWSRQRQMWRELSSI